MSTLQRRRRKKRSDNDDDGDGDGNDGVVDENLRQSSVVPGKTGQVGKKQPRPSVRVPSVVTGKVSSVLADSQPEVHKRQRLESPIESEDDAGDERIIENGDDGAQTGPGCETSQSTLTTTGSVGTVSKADHDMLKEKVQKMQEDQIYLRDWVKKGKKTKGLPRDELLEQKVKSFIRDIVFPRMKFITCDEELASVKGRLLQNFKLIPESEKEKVFWLTYGKNNVTESINNARSNAQTAAQKVCKGKTVIVQYSLEMVLGAILFSYPVLFV
jgi:hypothetical protein